MLLTADLGVSLVFVGGFNVIESLSLCFIKYCRFYVNDSLT